MSKRNIIGRAISVILTCTLCVTTFTGCGKKKLTDEDFANIKKIDKNCIFKQEEYKDILEAGDSVDVLGRNGDKILAVSKTQAGPFKYMSFNPDGSDVNSAEIGGGKDDYIVTGTFDKDGNAYVIYKECKEADGSCGSFLEKIEPTGNIAYKYDFSKEFDEDPFFIRCFAWTDKYGLLCGTMDGVQTFDEKNGLKVLVDRKNMNGMGGILSIDELADNKLFINYFDDSSYEGRFVVADADNNKVDKKLGGFQKHGFYSFFEDEAGNLYAEDDYGIYKCDIEADKLVKLLDFRDASISFDEMNAQAGFVALNEKEIIADTSVGDEQVNSLVKLTKVNPEDVGEKTVITLSGMYVDRDIVKQIMDFNRSSDKYAIKILDYSEFYDDFEQLQKQFNLDITSGKAADIICFSGAESSVRKYADKGTLLDLSAAFENGGPLGDIEILPNIKEMMKYNDKIYTFMPTFDISTFATKSENASGKQTLSYKDCDELITGKGMDYKTAFGSYYTRDQICEYFWMMYGDEFFDLKSKKCNFNTPEFTEFLNFANKFPDEEPVDYVIGDDILDDFAAGKSIFYAANYWDIWGYAETKQLAGDVELVGFPNNLGKNLATLNTTTFAVNSKTENVDVIYDLIRELMTSDKKSDNGFSSVKSKFEEELHEAAVEASDSNKRAKLYDPVSGEWKKINPLTEEDIKKFYDYAVSINTNAGIDMQVSSIVLEEASTFFAGQKTAEQVAEVIQNRVSNYIAENS